jgi:Flavin reductase like domain
VVSVSGLYRTGTDSWSDHAQHDDYSDGRWRPPRSHVAVSDQDRSHDHRPRPCPVGITINLLMSFSLAPLLVLVSVRHNGQAHSVLESTGAFILSLLSINQEHLARLFSSPDMPNGQEAAARLSGALCSLAYSVEEAYPSGDHSFFLGRVLDIGFGDVNRDHRCSSAVISATVDPYFSIMRGAPCLAN